MSSSEVERYVSQNEHLPALVGMDLVPVNGVLEAVRQAEADIVAAAMPDGAIMLSATNPEENLVILPAARNLERKATNDTHKQIFVRHGGELFIGTPWDEAAPGFGGVLKYGYKKAEQEGYKFSSAITVLPTEPWGTTEEELALQEAQQENLDALKADFIANHPLGEGALLVTNRYGGIDPTSPEATTRSMMTRFLYANELNIPNELGSYGGQGPSVEHGLLDYRLETLLGQSWVDLREAINPTLAIVEQMQSAGQDPTPVIPSLEGLVKTHVETFLEEWGPSIMLAAQMLKDPETTDHVLDALLKHSKTEFAETLRDGSVYQHRKR